MRNSSSERFFVEQFGYIWTTSASIVVARQPSTNIYIMHVDRPTSHNFRLYGTTAISCYNLAYSNYLKFSKHTFKFQLTAFHFHSITNAFHFPLLRILAQI